MHRFSFQENGDLFTDEDFAASLAWVPNRAGPVGFPYIPLSLESTQMTDGESGSDTNMQGDETAGGAELSVEQPSAPMLIIHAIDLDSDGSNDADYVAVSSDSNNSAITMDEEPTFSICDSLPSLGVLPRLSPSQPAAPTTGASPASAPPSPEPVPSPPPSTVDIISINGDGVNSGASHTAPDLPTSATPYPRPLCSSNQAHSHGTRSVTRELIKPYLRTHSNPQPLVPSPCSVSTVSSAQIHMWEQELALEREKHATTKATLKLPCIEQAMEALCTDCTEAHATIQKLEADNLHLQLSLKAECTKVHGVNIHSCILTCPDGLAEWEKQEEERVAHEAEQAAKAQEKEKAEHACTMTHIHNAVLQVFDQPFTYYKKKDNLRSLALTLELDDNGKVIDLQAQIKAHMQALAGLAQHPRFAGLYASKRAYRMHHSSGVASSSSGVVAPAPETLRLPNPVPSEPLPTPSLPASSLPTDRLWLCPPSAPSSAPLTEPAVLDGHHLGLALPAHPTLPSHFPPSPFDMPTPQSAWDTPTIGQRNTPSSIASVPGEGAYAHISHRPMHQPAHTSRLCIQVHTHMCPQRTQRGRYGIPTPTPHTPSPPYPQAFQHPPPAFQGSSVSMVHPGTEEEGVATVSASIFDPFTMGSFLPSPSTTHSEPGTRGTRYTQESYPHHF
ncbi:hypothetical protein K439DRAFT_1613942 [Ramaria rubella]|nr:hypothetical protein K439DRAFT_1613942 [Ramaria rubella]